MDSEHQPTDTTISTTHLIKGEDLNHHGTLYAGRCVEWSVQMAYIAAENLFETPRPLVFMSIRNLSMRAPVRLGDILQFTGRIDYIGETTIGVRVEGRLLQNKHGRKSVVNGSFLFCTVDQHGRSVPHGLPGLEPESELARDRWRRSVESLSTGEPV